VGAKGGGAKCRPPLETASNGDTDTRLFATSWGQKKMSQKLRHRKGRIRQAGKLVGRGGGGGGGGKKDKKKKARQSGSTRAKSQYGVQGRPSVRGESKSHDPEPRQTRGGQRSGGVEDEREKLETGTKIPPTGVNPVDGLRRVTHRF